MGGCSCKKSTLEKLEMRLRSWGWANLTIPYLKIADDYIFSRLGVLPTDMDNRIELYKKAKEV